MTAGQNHLKLIAVQRIGLKVSDRWQAQKTAVHRTFQNPLLDLIVEVAGDHLELDIGILPAEALQN